MIQVEIPVNNISMPVRTETDQHISLDNQHQVENCCASDSDVTLINSFKNLLSLYSMHVADSEKVILVSGGMQQYLIRHSRNKTRQQDSGQPRRGAGNESTTFHDLPDSLQLHILSYLDAQDLCMISSVCHHWYMLSTDELLWKARLSQDIYTWDVISHTTNPAMYKECQSDWSNKEIYLRCSPEVNEFYIRQQNSAFHSLSNMLRSFWPRKTPKVAMFGPGLESSTSGIVRKMVFEPSELFSKIGAFPGSFDGIGAGFTIKLQNGLQFNLSTLYTTTREERQRLSAEERLRHNRMLVQDPADIQGREGTPESSYQLNQSVKDFCRTVDAFIFVVDATQENTNQPCNVPLDYCCSELFAMVNERWSSPYVPLLILSCVQDANCVHMPTIDVVEKLQLAKLNRPWKVHHSVVSTLSGTSDGITWLLEQAQRR